MLYNKLVQASCEAATLAVIRVFEDGTLKPHSTLASRDPSSPDGNESDAGDLQPFHRA